MNVQSYANLVHNNKFTYAAIVKLCKNKKFRAHVRRLSRQAFKLNVDNYCNDDYYVSITFDNDDFVATVRSNKIDGHYMNVDELAIASRTSNADSNILSSCEAAAKLYKMFDDTREQSWFREVENMLDDLGRGILS